jgi:hypothetical protein
MARSANSYGDIDIENYVKALETRETADLEQELAHLYFDYLFVQTQMEASVFDGDNASVVQTGKRRLVRLQGKIEALKGELLGRVKKDPS